MRTLVRDIQKEEGKTVELMGWVAGRRDHGKLIFIDFRDRSGAVQIVFTPKLAQSDAATLRDAFVIKVIGLVKQRPVGMINEKLPNRLGYYEIEAQELEIINSAETLPLSLDTDGKDIGEDVRMKYRYLDLRRTRMQENIRNRARVINHIRTFLTARDFVEIETPILGKSTPEGARDYLVPARLAPGMFYALPQSPQQYKQLLMVSGFERYFQIARCFRDEDTRGDRQPEFTQLDLEMSFATQEEILALTEELYIDIVHTLYPEKHIQQIPFPRLSYDDVIQKYGSDKPDLRNDKNDPHELAFAFIINFPMFEKKDDGSLGAVHHPFTLPSTDTKINPHRFQHEAYSEYGAVMNALESEEDTLRLHAYQHDFVLNGYEIGGGSIRTYNKNLLAKVFERLGNAPEAVRAQFGHLLDAFQYGVPPHGGIAPGIDRFLMILQNEPNIREVIAFPKTGDGRDLMMRAPSEVSEAQLKELHLKTETKKK